MTHLKIQEYKGQILGLATTISIAAITLVPNAQVKTLIGSLFGGFSVGSAIAYQLSQSSANYQFSKFKDDLERKSNFDNNELTETTKKLAEANTERTNLKSALEKSQIEFKAISNLNSSNVAKLNQLGKVLSDKENIEANLTARVKELEQLQNFVSSAKSHLTDI